MVQPPLFADPVTVAESVVARAAAQALHPSMHHRRCTSCGTPIAPHRHWCSDTCRRADEGDD